MPTRRVALDDAYLPDQRRRVRRRAPRRGVAEHVPGLDEEQHDALGRLVDDARKGSPCRASRCGTACRPTPTDSTSRDTASSPPTSSGARCGPCSSSTATGRRRPQVIGAIMARVVDAAVRRRIALRFIEADRSPRRDARGPRVSADCSRARPASGHRCPARPRRARGWRATSGGACRRSDDGRWRCSASTATWPSTATTSSADSAASCGSPIPTRARNARARPSASRSWRRRGSALDGLLPPRRDPGVARPGPRPYPSGSEARLKTPVHVTVTGAAGQIGYALVHRIAAGSCSAPDQPVVLRLLEIEPAMASLEGVVMELEDGAHPLLAGIEPTADLKTAFDGTSWALLVGSIPRKAGMERGDLLSVNGGIFKPAGPGHQRPRRERRPRARGRQPLQHQLPHRPLERARRPRRPLVRDDAARREPRQVPARQEGRRAPRRGHQPRDLGQPLGHAVPRLRARAHRRQVRCPR